jgi:MFS family permease
VDDLEPVGEDETEGHAVPRLGRAGAAIRGLAIDITPLRESRELRLLQFGQVISLTGRQVTVLALAYQVYVLTGSSFAVGLISLVQIPPLAFFSIWGGTWADRFDRRTLILVTEFGLAASSVLLLLGALHGHPPLWYLYVVVVAQTAFFAVNSPTRSAVVPGVVRAELLPAAMALNQVMFQVTQVVGPLAAGLIIGLPSNATTGLAAAYGFDVVTFTASIGMTLALPSLPPARAAGEVVLRGWRAVREGFSFLRAKRVLISTFVIDLNAMIFGMPRALFPALALTVFHAGPLALGLMTSAPAVGAVIGALTTGWVSGVRKQGLFVIWSVVAWGAAITLFGLTGLGSGFFWLGLFFLALAGAADVVSAVFRSTILQESVPDSLRGRLNAINILVVTGGPRLGDFESGAVAGIAKLFMTPADATVFSAITGGVFCLIGVGIVSMIYPELARYRRPEALSVRAGD